MSQVNATTKMRRHHLHSSSRVSDKSLRHGQELWMDYIASALLALDIAGVTSLAWAVKAMAASLIPAQPPCKWTSLLARRHRLLRPRAHRLVNRTIVKMRSDEASVGEHVRLAHGPWPVRARTRLLRSRPAYGVWWAVLFGCERLATRPAGGFVTAPASVVLRVVHPPCRAYRTKV